MRSQRRDRVPWILRREEAASEKAGSEGRGNNGDNKKESAGISIAAAEIDIDERKCSKCQSSRLVLLARFLMRFEGERAERIRKLSRPHRADLTADFNLGTRQNYENYANKVIRYFNEGRVTVHRYRLPARLTALA